MHKRYITKEDVKLIDRCPKALYLKYKHPELKEDISKEQEAILKNGKKVGEFAWSLYNKGKVKGIDVSKGSTVWGDELVESTDAALAKDNCVLFEAGFTSLDGKLHSRVDILRKDMAGIKITEVKSTTSLKPYHILDAAFQWKVIKESGFGGNLEIALAYLNNTFVKKGPIDPNKLFTVENITERVKNSQDLIDTLIQKRENVLSENKIPNVRIGKQCWKGEQEFDCPFLRHCLKDLPEKSIWNIGGIHAEKAEKMQNEGIIEIKQIPKNTSLSEKQWIEVNSTLQDKPYIDRQKLREFLESLELHKPHYFMDFETLQPPIPKFDGDKPYSFICFQFCLLYQTALGNGSVQRVDFLAEPDTDSRRQFIETLLNATKKPGLIIVFNMTFEKTQLKELAKLYPDLAPEINERITRLRDLAIPFLNKHYYHPSLKGSYSLKKVMPVLVSDLTYDNLIINNGQGASSSYADLGSLPTNEQKISKEHLKKYCYLDVYSLQRISEKLNEMVMLNPDRTLLRKMIREVLEGYFQQRL